MSAGTPQHILPPLPERTRARLDRLSPWQRRGAAWLAGALSVLALAPFFLWPVLWLTLPALVALMDASAGADYATSRWTPWRRSAHGRAGEIGWWFGFGYHVAGLFWIGEAFLVEAEVFAWLLPFAVTLLPAGLALFMAAAAAAASWLAAPGWRRVLALALTIGVAEWLRGHVFSGFPWNILGYALTAPLVLMQSAAVVGVYGLTVIAVLVFAGPLEVWRTVRGLAGRPQRHARTAALALAAGPLLAMTAYGTVRLASAVADPGDGPRVRIVQPSVPQREKWLPENQRRIFDEHLELSRTTPRLVIDDAVGIDLLVWPEAAMPFVPLAQPLALEEIGAMLPERTHLVAGALRVEAADAVSRRRIFNSILVFARGPSARLVASYDKTHLVPFGEYLPLQRILEAIGLQQLSRLRGGFAAGVTPRPLVAIPGIGEIGMLVCYEILFPAAVLHTAHRPRALVNVTNDGWFGNTTGPHQHLHQARVRAVEEGLPVVRAANNGISAIIDAYGSMPNSLGLNVRGSLDGPLPPAIAAPTYGRFGDLIFFMMCGILLGVVLRVR